MVSCESRTHQSLLPLEVRSDPQQDHVQYKTGEDAYRGEEGYYILTDPAEQALGLPSGQYDVTLAISAKRYNSDGSLQFVTNHDAGLWGDIILV